MTTLEHGHMRPTSQMVDLKFSSSEQVGASIDGTSFRHFRTLAVRGRKGVVSHG